MFIHIIASGISVAVLIIQHLAKNGRGKKKKRKTPRNVKFNVEQREILQHNTGGEFRSTLLECSVRHVVYLWLHLMITSTSLANLHEQKACI